jgi:hypothetical protein
MLSAADNEMLTRTGPQTPMGQYMRHFWQPIALSRELPEPDGARCASTSWAKSWLPSAMRRAWSDWPIRNARTEALRCSVRVPWLEIRHGRQAG